MQCDANEENNLNQIVWKRRRKEKNKINPKWITLRFSSFYQLPAQHIIHILVHTTQYTHLYARINQYHFQRKRRSIDLISVLWTCNDVTLYNGYLCVCLAVWHDVLAYIFIVWCVYWVLLLKIVQSIYNQ